MHRATRSRSQMEPTQSVKGEGLMSTPRAYRPSARRLRMSASPRSPALPVTRIIVSGTRELRRRLHRVARRAEGGRDLVEDGGVVDGGGRAVLDAVSDPLHGAAKDLAR